MINGRCTRPIEAHMEQQLCFFSDKRDLSSCPGPCTSLSFCSIVATNAVWIPRDDCFLFYVVFFSFVCVFDTFVGLSRWWIWKGREDWWLVFPCSSQWFEFPSVLWQCCLVTGRSSDPCTCFRQEQLLLHPFNGFFQNNLGKPAPERSTILDFTGARDGGLGVASAGPYANHLHLAPDR